MPRARPHPMMAFPRCVWQRPCRTPASTSHSQCQRPPCSYWNIWILAMSCSFFQPGTLTRSVPKSWKHYNEWRRIMPENKAKRKDIQAKRIYQSETQRLLSLRLIAAPNPKDDLSDDELTALTKDPRNSPELIQQLIDYLKGL